MLMYAWMLATRQSREDRAKAEHYHDTVQDLLLDGDEDFFVEDEMMYYEPQFLFNQRHVFQRLPWVDGQLYQTCLKAVLARFDDG